MREEQRERVIWTERGREGGTERERESERPSAGDRGTERERHKALNLYVRLGLLR